MEWTASEYAESGLIMPIETKTEPRTAWKRQSPFPGTLRTTKYCVPPLSSTSSSYRKVEGRRHMPVVGSNSKDRKSHFEGGEWGDGGLAGTGDVREG
ncbi:hypothetical protein ACHAXA_009413 [Cyclostephanos tholiformis]|uniref:Uncharacterized protein n=1 Tax=Cyclostephanos tholiformis TaxID=382380 RepID=A0ABD3R9U7_9STRA